MLDPLNIPDVDRQELLARFVFSRSHLDRRAQRVKAGAFMPPANLELSVTRHRDATDAEIWIVGHNIAAERKRTLYGRSDALAATYESQKLRVVRHRIKGNPNHANVVGWPIDDKPAQKLKAEKIAAVATFVETPDSQHQ